MISDELKKDLKSMSALDAAEELKAMGIPFMLEFDNTENITDKDVDAMFEDIVMATADGYNFLMLKRLLYQVVESDSEKANELKQMLYQFYKLCHYSLNDRA